MKIAFIGPECSGKTTLALELTKIYSGHFIPEFAREYLTSKKLGYQYVLDDLVKIAKHQFNLINSTNNFENHTFIDTEMMVMKIWAIDKFGHCPYEIENLLLQQKIDFYFLCKPDFPWEYDSLREDSERRDKIFEMYILELDKSNIKYQILSGDFQSKIKKIKLILHID